MKSKKNSGRDMLFYATVAIILIISISGTPIMEKKVSREKKEVKVEYSAGDNLEKNRKEDLIRVQEEQVPMARKSLKEERKYLKEESLIALVLVEIIAFRILAYK